MDKLLISGILLCAACTAQQGSYGLRPGEPSQLNFEYCEQIAAEVRRAGDISNNLCPGFMPDGYPIELG